MAAAVARQEDDLGAVQATEQHLVGGLAEGALHRLPAPLLQSLNVVDTAAADHPDDSPIALCAQQLTPLFRDTGGALHPLV